MKMIDEDEIFYYNSGDDIRVSYFPNLDVYNTKFKNHIKFNTTQLESFIKKIQDN